MGWRCFARLRGDARHRTRFGALRLRRRRAALPADRPVDRRRRRPRPARRVRARATTRDFYPVHAGAARPRSRDGRLHEPHGLGLPAAASRPPTRSAARTAVELFLAAAGGAGLRARRGARAAAGARAVGDRRRRWSCGALAARARLRDARSPPRCSAARCWRARRCCALRVRERPRGARGARVRRAARRRCRGSAPTYLAARRRRARRRCCAGCACAARRLGRASRAMELVVASAVGLHHGQRAPVRRPDAVRAPPRRARPTGAASPRGYLDRAYRGWSALWIDRDYGLLRWAPFLALAFFAAWLLWRSRRERLARAIPGQRDVEVAAALLLGASAAPGARRRVPVARDARVWFPGRRSWRRCPWRRAGAPGACAAPRAWRGAAALTLRGQRRLRWRCAWATPAGRRPAPRRPGGRPSACSPLYGDLRRAASARVGARPRGWRRWRVLALRERRRAGACWA